MAFVRWSQVPLCVIQRDDIIQLPKRKGEDVLVVRNIAKERPGRLEMLVDNQGVVQSVSPMHHEPVFRLEACN